MKNYNSLFEGLSLSEIEKLNNCLNVKEERFEAGVEISKYSKSANLLGVVKQGKVVIKKLDTNGNTTILDQVEKNGVFSKAFEFVSTNVNYVSAYASEPTVILFFDYDSVFKRCEKACIYHSIFVENLFNTVMQKAKNLSERIEILSNKTIREKILSYASLALKNGGENTFVLPMSLTSFAEFLCVDRSAMMRELKKLSVEGVLKVNKRTITVCNHAYI